MIPGEKGQIEISPDFQRGEVWRNSAQTLFIDSLMKQLPIPSMCISLDISSQKRMVIDGLQRISSIIKFLDNKIDWRLSKNEDVDIRISDKKVSEIRKDEDVHERRHPRKDGKGHLQEILILQRSGGSIAQDQQDDPPHLHQGAVFEDHLPQKSQKRKNHHRRCEF